MSENASRQHLQNIGPNYHLLIVCNSGSTLTTAAQCEDTQAIYPDAEAVNPKRKWSAT